MNRIPTPLVRQVLLLLLILGLGALLFWTLQVYVPALLGAYTLYVLLRPVAGFLSERWHWPKALGALVLIFLSVLAIWTPVQFLVQLVQAKVIFAVQHSPEIWQNIETAVHRLEEQYGIRVLTPEMVKDIANWGVEQLRLLISATMNGIATTVLAAFILYFMLTNGPKMEASFFNWLPLRTENVAELKHQMNNLVFSNAVGIPFMGILQGLAGLPAYWLAGVNDIWLWFAITCIAGMLPILGVALAYIPMAILMVANGMPLKGLLLFLYGFIVIGSIDNIGRMWLQKKLEDIHPLITLFGVIAGLKLFGFIGFVFGPILISLFLLLIRIYTKEFGREAHHTH